MRRVLLAIAALSLRVRRRPRRCRRAPPRCRLGGRACGCSLARRRCRRRAGGHLRGADEGHRRSVRMQVRFTLQSRRPGGPWGHVAAEGLDTWLTSRARRPPLLLRQDGAQPRGTRDLPDRRALPLARRRRAHGRRTRPRRPCAASRTCGRTSKPERVDVAAAVRPGMNRYTVRVRNDGPHRGRAVRGRLHGGRRGAADGGRRRPGHRRAHVGDVRRGRVCRGGAADRRGRSGGRRRRARRGRQRARRSVSGVARAGDRERPRRLRPARNDAGGAAADVL